MPKRNGFTSEARHGHRGYTAIELLTTISVLSIVTALAVPGLRNFIQNNRAATEANAVVSALHLARNETTTRGVPVTICASSDGESCTAEGWNWADGWIVFVDPVLPLGSVNDGDTVLRAFPALGTDSVLRTAGIPVGSLSYASTGFLIGNAGVRFDLQIPHCTGDHNRTITVNLQGRAGVAPAAC